MKDMGNLSGLDLSHHNKLKGNKLARSQEGRACMKSYMEILVFEGDAVVFLRYISLTIKNTKQ